MVESKDSMSLENVAHIATSRVGYVKYRPRRRRRVVLKSR